MNSWLTYAFLTILCWGAYGIFLHGGAVGMADPDHGRIKAFFFVGIAYFLVAVLAPWAFLAAQGVKLDPTMAGAGWSLAAGIVGAIGAFGVLLAFGAGGRPSVVMTLIFAGAPIVNALVGITKAGAWGDVRWPFVLGMALAIVGGGLVTTYKPAPHAPPTDAPKTP